VRRLLPAAFFLYGAAVAVRLGSAELFFRNGSLPQTQRALHALGATPNSSYIEHLADVDIARTEAHLRDALRQDPRLTRARIRLGLLEEQRGDISSAERTLLQAAHYDHQYLPAWTLANFYFRREDAASFWQWSRIAIQLSPADDRPILRLASEWEPNPSALLARLEAGEQVAYPYLDLLTGAGRFDSAQKLARDLLGRPAVQEQRLLDLSVRQLEAGNVSWALEIWNALAGGVGVRLNPDQGPLLPARVFEVRDGRGFHLKALTNPGVQAAWQSEGAVFSFEGTEPDLCFLLDQPFPAPQRRMRYRLHFEYKSELTGVRWRLEDSESAALAANNNWQNNEWTTPVPPGKGRDGLRVLVLQLRYRRDAGTIPARGDFALRNLKLEAF
jgi:hypothetical protein